MPHQQPGRRPRLAWALLGLALVLLASGLVLGLTGGESWTAVLGAIPVEAAFAVVGALVAARTGNRLGWLFLAAGTVGAVTVATNAYAARAATAELPAAAWVGWIFTITLGITAPLFFLTPLLFPDGRLPSPRWRPVVAIAVISGLIQMVCPALSDVNFSSNFPRLRDPVVAVAPLGTIYNGAEAVGTLVLLPAAAAIIIRFRRAGEEERLQLKWFTYAAAVAAVVLLAVTQLSNDPLPAFEIVFPLIPAAVGIAILKYRLYDIDRLISRTLSYAVVTGAAGRPVRRAGPAGHRGAVDQVAGRGRRVHARGGGAVHSAAPARTAGGGPPVQPGPLRRRPDHRRVRRPAAGGRCPRRGALRSAGRGEHRRRARARLDLDRPGR